MLQYPFGEFNIQRPDGIFGFTQWIPFRLYEKLPHFPRYAPNPFLFSHPSFQYYPIAWHSYFPVVHPHSQSFRMLKAVSTNNLEQTINLLENGFPVDSTIDHKYGYSAIQLAAIHNNYPLIQLLAIRGSDINQKDKWGNTPLLNAVTNQNYEAIHSLLRNGGDPLAANNYGMTPIAKAQNAPSIKQFLNSYTDKKRNFPRFRVHLRLQQKFSNPFWNQILKSKVYTSKVKQNFLSRWQFDFSDYRLVEELIK